ncbi:hypothetical protein [Marininema halotolerans]|uniref:Uncharacterized protein n=1 Tax=Marininema halotolerans TaxID=1155944 RepID=A0A1I6PZA3_9BACL|nr:hypothetical protein [Marininema halotolerans]SFS45405.1 hypothetical protein SAMN05444972_102231 [Marininema halotolerans]
MGVLQLQTFLTRYIRDKSLREKVKSLPIETRYSEFGFSKEELKLAVSLDFTQLDRTVNQLDRERRAKRRADFAEFTTVLQQVGVFDSFFSSFCKRYTDGFLTPDVEAKRFYDHAQQYIYDNQLPDILADLATYSFQVFNVSQVSLQDPYNNISLNFDRPLYLKRPFSIKTVSYNLIDIIDNDEIKRIEDLAVIPKKQTTYFFQKDYLNAISSNIFEIDDPIFFRLLDNNLTGNEILNKADSLEEMEEWKNMICEIYDLEIIGMRD